MTEPADIRTILEAQLRGEKTKLFESSLSRIMSHAQNAKEQGFAILTSWRQANEKSTNLTNFSALQHAVREKGLGYIQLRGHWQECQDSNVPYSQCPPEQLKDSIEPSIMVFGIDQKLASDLGKQFDQDAVVYAGPETGGATQLHFKDGSTMDIGTFSPMAVGQAYSEYRSRSDKKAKGLPPAERHFMFEGWSYPAQNFMDKLIEQTLEKNIKALTEGIRVLPSKK